MTVSPMAIIAGAAIFTKLWSHRVSYTCLGMGSTAQIQVTEEDCEPNRFASGLVPTARRSNRTEHRQILFRSKQLLHGIPDVMTRENASTQIKLPARTSQKVFGGLGRAKMKTTTPI